MTRNTWGGGASMSMMYWRSRADPKKDDDTTMEYKIIDRRGG